MYKILIIEDNKIIAENISLYLTAKWYQSSIAHDGEEAFDTIRSVKYDFLIIDRMIPRIDGLSLVRMMQARGIEIAFLFLTALDKQVDKIEWLSLGADDYLVKPFDLEELRLRIENIMKRRGSWNTSKKVSDKIWGISLDRDARQVSRHGHSIELSPKEYSILELLWENQGTVLSRESIYESLWWDESDLFSNTLDTINVHIAHIRKKLDTDIIRTVKLSWYIIDKN
jgi:two-component system, OmpR family, response regulator QseB